MLISSFLTYLQNEKRYSPHTIQSYKTDLIQFKDFLQANFELEVTVVQTQHVRSFIVDLLDHKISENAIGRKISTLRSFYKHLLREKEVKVNPMLLIKAPKVPKRLPVFIEEVKMDSLLDNAENFEDGFSGQRDKMVLELLFGTGVRLAELLQVKENDIDFYEGTIKVLGKRNKERIIPLHGELIKQLKAYLALKSIENFNNKSTTLIVTNTGASAYPKLIYRIVNRYLTLISTQDKKSPHVLRHSFASSLLNRGADLNAIKELLGHASLAATQVYTHNSVERLKSIYKQAHPKA
ncbi:tyrosine-type recombinase/integrase [Pedobacter sp. LMG 31464]|uniref:Tyrosine recombinase XerC n=1 Tax=Pedobacter planticolens TaxID=2679964 RepID=A0A923IY76_9SPHI|nr:tyrosine-type recombinase/integrase [Pedobacter planticolens]MBB2147147.1 tyrosine-type recombinase/integrase [Pedobacter planticolens]